MYRSDGYYMDIAEAVSRNSPCNSRKIGAVIVFDDEVVSVGFNGTPFGIESCWDILDNVSTLCLADQYMRDNLCPRKVLGYESGKGLEFCPANHAEVNAIINAMHNRREVLGATLYCNCPIPCKVCAGYIIASGISEVVCSEFIEYEGVISVLDMFDRAGVVVREAK